MTRKFSSILRVVFTIILLNINFTFQLILIYFANFGIYPNNVLLTSSGNCFINFNSWIYLCVTLEPWIFRIWKNVQSVIKMGLHYSMYYFDRIGFSFIQLEDDSLCLQHLCDSQNGRHRWRFLQQNTYRASTSYALCCLRGV